MIRAICFSLAVLLPGTVHAQALFGLDARRAELQNLQFAIVKEHCLAAQITLPSPPSPFPALVEKEGYGADTSAQPFAWSVMVEGGRALAGDSEAAKRLKELLLVWARAGALLETKPSSDTYYALKRLMLPVIVNYSIVVGDFSREERAEVEVWIAKLVLPLDTTFGGEVDHNNHRYLADAVLMAWGVLTGDKDLYGKGVARYRAALVQAEEDGALPLEARRGARAMWYMRHALSSLTVMAELSGRSLYQEKENGKTIDTLLRYFLNGTEDPQAALPHAAENHKPGPAMDFRRQDTGFLARRGHGRHYMAFAEALIAHHESPEVKRLAALMGPVIKERPWIDEYAGGNATCFWTTP